MSKKKVTALVLCVMLLCGCGASDTKNNKTGEISNQSSTELYKGLDAKDTYQKACDYFDEKITYYKEINIETSTGGENANPGVSYAEAYRENGKKSASIKWISSHLSMFTVYKDEKYHSQIYDDVTKYTAKEQKEEYNKRQGPFIKPLLQSKEDDYSKTEFVDIAREDKDGEIVISVKYKYKSASIYEDGSKEWSESSYNIRETYIGKDGFIYKIIVKVCDEGFTNAHVSNTNTLSDFNKKKTFDYDQEVKSLKKYENMGLEEFKNELGIS